MIQMETVLGTKMAKTITVSIDREQPMLEHADIETPDLDKLSKLIRELTGAGMPLFPDDEVENRIRDYMGFPHKPEDDGGDLPPTEDTELELA